MDFNKDFKHIVLRDALRNAIVSGQYKAGDRLPSENELCRKYKLSNTTVREAIASLAHEGLVDRIQGRGTFVSKRKTSQLTFGLIMHNILYDEEYRRASDVATALLHNVEKSVRDLGAGIQLYLDNCIVDIERKNLLDIIERRLDGAIVLYIGEEKNLDCLRKIIRADIPLVLIDRYMENFPCSYVVTDNFSGAYNSVRYLFSQGYEDIFFLLEGEEDCSSVRDRVAGYRAALEECGRSIDNSMIKDSSNIEKSVKEMLDTIDGRFGIFAVHSLLIPEVLDSLEKIGVEHNNVGIACFDEPPVRIPEDMTFVKVIQPLESMARKSVQIIMDRLNGNRDIECVLLEPEVWLAKEGRRLDTKEF